MSDAKKAVILVSGGLDSATCLAINKAEGFDCYALSFDYGQRHRSELVASQRVAQALGAVEHKTIAVGLDQLGGSALTDDTIAVPDYEGNEEIPITYVPARNTIFLSIALGWAEVLNADRIVIGASFIDYSGYPDCRPEYFDAWQQLASLATKVGVEGQVIEINTPLLNLSKAATIQRGLELGVDYSLTVSCYQATMAGLACGHCDSCVLRKQGFAAAEVADPTHYIKATDNTTI